MTKPKDFTVPLTETDVLDVRMIIEKGEIIGFVLNYRIRIDNVWYQVYRVDTCHNYLHEQRFWQSPEPIAIPKFDGTPLKFVFDFYMEEIRDNYEKFKSYYVERMGLG